MENDDDVLFERVEDIEPRKGTEMSIAAYQEKHHCPVGRYRSPKGDGNKVFHGFSSLGTLFEDIAPRKGTENRPLRGHEYSTQDSFDNMDPREGTEAP